MNSGNELPFESIEDAILEARGRVTSILSPRSGVEGDALRSLIRASWHAGFDGPSYERMGAVDGSNNSDYLTLGQVIFAVSSSLFMKDEAAIRARKYQIGVMDDYHYRERVSFCRETMEVKMALRSLSLDPEVVLMDGSLIAAVDRGLWATPYGQKVPFYMRRILMEVEASLGLDLTEGLVSQTHLAEVSSTLEGIIESALEGELGRSPDRDEVRRAKAFIERYEKLVSLNKLLKESKALLVAVAKRSGSRAYFNSRLPDMEVVRRYTSLERGFLTPKVVKLSFPDYSGIEDSYDVTLTYARLERGAYPLRIEVLGRMGPDEISQILGSLAKYSIRGYPYHLRVVHEMAKIGREMMAHLARNLLVPGVSGREVLGE